MITIQYFAQLREQRGCSQETLQTQAPTVRDLFEELRERHGFDLTADNLKVAINDRLTSRDAPLGDGDTVFFIPPVAGG